MVHTRIARLGLVATLALAGCVTGGDGSSDLRATVAESSTSTLPTTTTSTVPPTTTSTTTTTTTIPAPRELTIEVEPVAASLAVTDATGSAYVGPAPFTGPVAGAVELVVKASGFETETIVLGEEETSVTPWLDKSGQVLDKLLEFDTGPAPKQVAFRPGHDELWVTLLAGRGFEVYDPASGRQIAAVDLPKAGSVEVIFNRTGTRAYISQMETASVYEIDAETKEVLRQISTGGVWTKVMVLSPDEQTLWASNWVSNDVSEIDLATGEVRRKLSTVRTPRGLFVTPDGAKLYVAGFASGQLQVFDLATGEGTVLHRTGGAMRHLVGSPDGSIVYGSEMALDTIVATDTATDEVTNLAVVDRLPNTIDVSPDGRLLFVSNRGRNNPETYYRPGPEWGTVVVLDTATGAYLDAIVGGNQTTGLDVSPDGTLLAFSDFLDDRIVIYRIPGYEELLAGGGGRWEAHAAELVK
ncbi:MAG: YncE family protein [Acidimicrobiia bacterium]|nr:YncE family protein [Acidimicrobiia bacterium]